MVAAHAITAVMGMVAAMTTAQARHPPAVIVMTHHRATAHSMAKTWRRGACVVWWCTWTPTPASARSANKVARQVLACTRWRFFRSGCAATTPADVLVRTRGRLPVSRCAPPPRALCRLCLLRVFQGVEWHLFELLLRQVRVRTRHVAPDTWCCKLTAVLWSVHAWCAHGGMHRRQIVAGACVVVVPREETSAEQVHGSACRHQVNCTSSL